MSDRPLRRQFDELLAAPAGVPEPIAQGPVVLYGAGGKGREVLTLLRARGCEVAAFIDRTATGNIEPDPANYATLTGRLVAASPCDEVSIWPCGLDEMPQQVLFRADGLASSGIAADGNLLVQTVALDAGLPMYRPTNVKLDIAGAEAAALRGMAKTIRASRPALAVCVYHKPADLWEIPMLVDDLLPDSDVYLRAHAWNGFDLVFYAVPREMTRV